MATARKTVFARLSPLSFHLQESCKRSFHGNTAQLPVSHMRCHDVIKLCSKFSRPKVPISPSFSPILWCKERERRQRKTFSLSPSRSCMAVDAGWISRLFFPPVPPFSFHFYVCGEPCSKLVPKRGNAMTSSTQFHQTLSH